MIDPAARARLERWKQSLLDLSTASELLDIADRKTSIALRCFELTEVVAALAAGATFGIEAGPELPIESGKLRTPLATTELDRRIVAIDRLARARLADAGVHALWLGIGLVTWCDIVGQPHTAPLVLWPVTLADGRIAQAELEPRCNHALAEKLRRELEIALPDDVPTPETIAALLDTAAAIAVTRPGWRFERMAVLGIMSIAGHTMWADIEARGDELLAHPVIRQLATGMGAFAQPSPAAQTVIDLCARNAPPPADLIAPLDADAAQLAAITAAASGASFVVHGAPGTGKTQTIANLIAHSIAQGKTVLFVSEHVAALEAAQQRLATVGLAEFCLPLHGHEGTRTRVLSRLGHVLERAFRPGNGPAADDARLAQLRATLDEHVAALHRVGPFGRSLHEVLGRLVELRTTARAALAERDATGLDRIAFERRKQAVDRLAAAALPVEPVATHPWRASTLTIGHFMRSGLIDGRERALAALDDAAEAAAVLGIAARDVASLVPGVIARTRDQLVALGTLATLAARSPRPGAELLTSIARRSADEIPERIALIRARGTGTVETPRDPHAFIALAHRHRLLAAEVNDRFTDAVEGVDAARLWNQLRTWTDRVAPLRYVALRAVRNEIRAVAMPGMLETDDAMITALEAVIAERAARQALLAAAEPAKRWLGELGGDALGLDQLDLPRIHDAVAWSAELRRAFDAVAVAGGDPARQAAWRALVAQVAANPTPSAGAGELAAFSRLADGVARWQPALGNIADATGIPIATLGEGDDHLAALRDRIETLRHSIDSLPAWVAFHAARIAALEAGIGPAVPAIERGDLGAAELADGWERATLLAWCEAELAHTPALAGFHGAQHHAHAAAFADLDRAALALVRARALVRLAERVPRVPTGPRDVGARKGNARGTQVPEPTGELGVLVGELRGRTRRSLRQLFAEIPTLLPRVAPCLIATPLAVAQYLDPALKIDLVIFDEASQLPTAHALGALARGACAVVFGDQLQLPATRWVAGDLRLGEPIDAFAETATLPVVTEVAYADTAAIAAPPPEAEPRFAAEPEDNDDAGAFERVDGLLDDCILARLPELRLAWHYRSKHEDLIAFANRRFYRDQLQVLPTAQPSVELGIAWRKLDGVYERGANRVEADAIVADVVARLADPAQRTRSIGIVTFTLAQQQLIEDLLAKHPVPDGLTEPLFVKQVEAAQGDERDVIVLSVGFDRHVTSFGPLSLPDGEHRLAVATTRAREQLVVVSSLLPEELADGSVPGLAALLEVARAPHAIDDAPPASPITAAIARALTQRGWVLRHQVGCGVYKVDLAVVDPNDPERYVLAIEHDGIAYANATAARDRDRLRPQLLAQLGWRLHRIWSLDWWLEPEREVQRAHAAIVTAVAANRQRRASAPVRVARSGRTRTARGTEQPPVATGSGPTETPELAALGSAPTATGSAPIRIARNTIPIGPYMAAAIPAGRRAPDDLFAPRHTGELEKIVEQVLAAEAPMHVDVLARRVGAYFGIGRLSQRVVDQVKGALAGRGRYGDEDNIVWRLDQDPATVPAVRVAGIHASGRREIEEVPLLEVAAAARIVVERATGIPAKDLVRDAARLLGFARTTEKVIERVSSGVRLAVQRELIRLDDGKATLLE